MREPGDVRDALPRASDLGSPGPAKIIVRLHSSFNVIAYAHIGVVRVRRIGATEYVTVPRATLLWIIRIVFV